MSPVISPAPVVSTFPAVSLLDYAAHGETIIYPESALIVYPANLTPVQAAAVNTGLFTAYFALMELAHLKKDQQVVITAASSSMGIAAIQMTKAIGAKSIAVTRSEAKKEALLGAGATDIVAIGVDGAESEDQLPSAARRTDLMLEGRLVRQLAVTTEGPDRSPTGVRSVYALVGRCLTERGLSERRLTGRRAGLPISSKA